MNQKISTNITLSKDQIQALVVKTDNDFAWMEVRRDSGCGGCEQQMTCGLSSLTRFFTKSHITVKAENHFSLKAGDTVMLAFGEKDILKSAFVAYMVPMLMFFVMLMFGTWLSKVVAWQSEWPVLISGLIGLLIGGLYLQYYKSTGAVIVHKCLV